MNKKINSIIGESRPEGDDSFVYPSVLRSPAIPTNKPFKYLIVLEKR